MPPLSRVYRSRTAVEYSCVPLTIGTPSAESHRKSSRAFPGGLSRSNFRRGCRQCVYGNKASLCSAPLCSALRSAQYKSESIHRCIDSSKDVNVRCIRTAIIFRRERLTCTGRQSTVFPTAAAADPVVSAALFLFSMQGK